MSQAATHNIAVQCLVDTLTSLPGEHTVQDLGRQAICVEVACALYSFLHPHTSDIKFVIALQETQDAVTHQVLETDLVHAYLEVGGVTMDVRGTGAFERLLSNYPDEDQDASGRIKRTSRVEMDMSTEERRIAALEVMRSLCTTLTSPIDDQLVGSIREMLSQHLPPFIVNGRIAPGSKTLQ